MVSREVPLPVTAGVFEKRNNMIKLKKEHENLDVRIEKTFFSNMLVVESDARLKYNIEDVSPKLSTALDNLVPKQYYFKKDKEKKKHFGFLAQDLERKFPNLVIDVDNIKTINYLEILPLLLLKVQTMQKELDELKNK